MKTKTTTPKKVAKKAAPKTDKPKKPMPPAAVAKRNPPFEKGNKVAEKWTEATVMPILDKMLGILATDDSGQAEDNMVRANDIKLIGEIRIMCGVTKQRWSEWREKFKENQRVSDRMELIEEILECRLIYSGENIDIFILKNKYGYKDKTEVDNNVQLKGSIDPDQWLKDMSSEK